VLTHHKDVPYRLLEAVPELSCGDPNSGNLIVQGDNLHALKALLPRYAGQADWEIADFEVSLGDAEFATAVEAPRRARLEVGKNERIGVDVYEELVPQLKLFSRESGWTATELVHWLDRNLPFPYADPDFLVELDSGVVVAVEYKGADRAMTPDSIEKKRIGELWAARSGGRCRFAWVENRNWAALRAAVQ
jgi:hypothetical protein